MPAITVSYQASAVFLNRTHIRTQIAGAGGVVASQSVTVLPTTAGTAGKFQVRGIALNSAGAGQAVDVLEDGYVAGFDVSALAYDSLVYVSDTTGMLSTTPGSNTSVAGRVAAMTDRDPVTGKPSKVLFVRPSAV